MSIECPEDFEGLAQAGQVVAATLKAMAGAVRAGVTTAEVDRVGESVLNRYGAMSAPRLFYGFPGVNLISVNDEIIHGIPGDRVLEQGDIVSLDVTAELNGYIADAATTIPIPPYSAKADRLCRCARTAFEKAVAVARANKPINCIGHAVEHEVKRQGFWVVSELAGHGVGRVIHEDPIVANTYNPLDSKPLTTGLVITIEPMIAEHPAQAVEDCDGWTVKTSNGSLSAHFEHTVVITDGRPILLTAA
ncbi:MAG: type I methionyl aminopeptidase [Gemmatimonadetes bacterium]|nr:type I methionyl aminopeptidase [Gemmatimonadota bacterium]